MEALKCYNKEIRKAKGSSGRGHCQGIEAVPGGARLKKIMVKKVTHKVGSLKLRNGHYTQAGNEALQE
jgi:hypothetical protein